MNEVQLDERLSNLALASELQWHCEPAKWSIRPGDRILRISPDANTDRELARRKPQGFSPGGKAGFSPASRARSPARARVARVQTCTVVETVV